MKLAMTLRAARSSRPRSPLLSKLSTPLRPTAVILPKKPYQSTRLWPMWTLAVDAVGDGMVLKGGKRRNPMALRKPSCQASLVTGKTRILQCPQASRSLVQDVC